jgi:hypothetical protein
MGEYYFTINDLVWLFLLGLLAGVMITILYNYYNPVCSFSTPNNLESSTKQARGFYDYDGFYCVATKGRNAKNINTTEYHEACHALIDKDYEHFCKKTR